MSGTGKREVKKKGNGACCEARPLRLRQHPLQTPRCPPQMQQPHQGARRINTI